MLQRAAETPHGKPSGFQALPMNPATPQPAAANNSPSKVSSVGSSPDKEQQAAVNEGDDEKDKKKKTKDPRARANAYGKAKDALTALKNEGPKEMTNAEKCLADHADKMQDYEHFQDIILTRKKVLEGLLGRRGLFNEVFATLQSKNKLSLQPIQADILSATKVMSELEDMLKDLLAASDKTVLGIAPNPNPTAKPKAKGEGKRAEAKAAPVSKEDKAKMPCLFFPTGTPTKPP